MTVLRRMAEFAYGLRYSELVDDVRYAARRHLADSAACMAGASGMDAVEAVRAYALGRGGRAESTLIGTRRKAPAALAALVNGTMVRYLDANDIVARAGDTDSGHFSDALPALLALAERHGRSGEELLTCIVAAYELQGALSESFQFMKRGYHALTQVPWTLPIVASRLIGAPIDAAVSAAALSGSTGMVFNTWLKPTTHIPTIKGVSVGLAGQRAVEAAELAAAGVTASDDALETAFERLGPLANAPADMSRYDELERRWLMTRQTIKSYPAQIYTQAAIEATLALHARGARADAIQRLTLRGHSGVCGGVQGSAGAFAPTSRESADHSTPFVMAMALLHGKLTLREYEGEPWLATNVRDVMGRIELVVEPERERAFMQEGALGVDLTALLADGRVERAAVRQPKGHPDAPLSQAELLAKMRWLVEDVEREGTAERILEICMGMQSADDVTALIDACAV